MHMIASESTSLDKPFTQNEAGLAELDEVAQALVRSAGTGIYIVQQGKFQYVNPLFQELTGFTEAELIGIYSLDLVHPDDRAMVRKKAIDSLKGLSILPYEYRFIKKDGGEIWILEKVTSIVCRGKPATGGSFTDITERKKAELDLYREKAYIEKVMSSLPDMLITINSRQEITYVNSAMAQFVGLEAESIVGKRMEQVLEEVHLLTPEAAIAIAEKVRQRLQTGELSTNVEIEIRNCRGELVPCIYTASGMLDSNGEVMGEVVLIRDISELKRAENQLRESEGRFRTLFDAMSEGVVLMDATGKMLKINPAAEAIFGLKHSEIEGFSTSTAGIDAIHAIHPDGSLLLPSEMASPRAISEKRPVVGDVTGINHPDGTISWFMANANPLLDDNNQVTGAVTTFIDITERKQAEEEREALFDDLKGINRRLGESNQELQDFVYVASHDLREPLRKIVSFGSLLQDSLEGKLDEDQEENLGFMIDGAGRMQKMIDDLLIYSRVTTRARPFEKVELNKVVDDLKGLEMATLLGETKGTIHISGPLPPVQGDSSQMHQLLQNLVGNGLKFHREGIAPEITISAHRAGNDMVRVEVQDNGIGIAEEYQEQVFTMFKRLHSRIHYDGTGIGLAICKKIVNRHGGAIGVESVPGEGATFWFTLAKGQY